MSNETIIIDTPEGIQFVRLLSFRSAMGLEIRTGMKMSRGRSVFQLAREQGLATKRSKRDVYAELDALVVAAGGESKPLD